MVLSSLAAHVASRRFTFLRVAQRCFVPRTLLYYFLCVAARFFAFLRVAKTAPHQAAGSGLVANRLRERKLRDARRGDEEADAFSPRDVTDTDRESFFAEKTEARVSDRTDDAPSADGFSTRA